MPISSSLLRRISPNTFALVSLPAMISLVIETVEIPKLSAIFCPVLPQSAKVYIIVKQECHKRKEESPDCDAARSGDFLLAHTQYDFFLPTDIISYVVFLSICILLFLMHLSSSHTFDIRCSGRFCYGQINPPHKTRKDSRFSVD